MNRALAVTRIHLVLSRRWNVYFPLALLAAILLFNAAIGLAVGAAFTTGGLTAIYVSAAVVQLTAMTQFFPFVLGLGVTRRDFWTGTVLFAVLQSVGFAALLTAGLAVERATGGWGTGLGSFRFDVPDGAGLLTAGLVFLAVLLAACALGMAMGVVVKRWGQLGVWAVVVGATAVLTAAVLVITWQEWWPQVIAAVVGAPPSAAVTVPLAVAVLLAGAGWLGLRRATP